MRQRIEVLQKILSDEKIDYASLLQNKDLFYFSGTMKMGSY